MGLDLATQRQLITVLEKVSKPNPTVHVKRFICRASWLKVRLVFVHQVGEGLYSDYASLGDGTQCLETLRIVESDRSHVRKRKLGAVELVNDSAALGAGATPVEEG